MKMRLLFVILAAAVFSSCGQAKVKNFDYGHVENGKYINSYFNFEVTLPGDWVVQSKEATQKIADMGKDLVTGEDKKLKAMVKASEINTANLLAVFRYEVGAAVDYNPSFLLVAENLQNAPGVQTGGDYLFHTRKFLQQSQIQYDHIDDEFSKEVINGQEYYIMNLAMNYAGLTIYQTYYSTIKDRFCISAAISYTNQEEKDMLLKIVETMTFK